MPREGIVDENEGSILDLLHSREKNISEYIPYVNELDFSKLTLLQENKEITILDMAQIYSNYELFEILLEKYNSTGKLTERNPNRHQKMSMIRSLVDRAIYEGDYDFLEMCLKYVIDIHELNDREESYLETAVEYSDPSDPDGFMIEAMKLFFTDLAPH